LFFVQQSAAAQKAKTHKAKERTMQPERAELYFQQGSSNEVYLHASMAIKEKALAKATSSKTRNGRYRPNDRLLAFLKSL
jgi:DNA-nicking Smr family endonuclease